MIIECLVEELKNLDTSHPAIVAWGEKLKPGETLFAYREGDYTHDVVWVRADTPISPDMRDSGFIEARISLFARSYNQQKAKKFIEEIAKDWNGKVINCGGYSFLMRAESIEPYAFLLDTIGRTTWTMMFYLEGRNA